MRKIFCLALILLTVALTGCGSSDEKNSVKVGTLTQLNSTPEQAANISGGAMNFYDNFNSMQMALQSQTIDKIQTYSSVAGYMTANNSGLAIDTQSTIEIVDNFCCAMRDGDADLKNSFDAAISSMKADGTLDALAAKYIRNPSPTPQAVAMPHIDGAQTIKVGVTGDLPPLDLVLPDGTPAGFNTAVLAEISKRIDKNIQLLQIDSGARAVALTSGQVDVIFWVIVPEENSNRPKNLDTPEGVAVTGAYYQDKVVHVHIQDLSGAFAN